MLQKYKLLQFEEMWKSIRKMLLPIGLIPDKASLDNRQIFKLYLELENSSNEFRDLIQISIMKKELAHLFLQNLVN